MSFLNEAKMEELANVLGHLSRHTVFKIGSVEVTSTVVNTWIVMAVISVVFFVLTRRLSDDKPSRAQTILEYIVEFIYGLLETGLGREGRAYLPLIGTIFIFVLSLNFSWFIPGMVPPVTDFSTPIALAVVTIFAVHFLGAKKGGLKHYLHNYTAFGPVVAPLFVIEEVVKPFSLAIRLFGNMFGEKMVVTVLFILVPLFFPTPVMLIGVIMGLIQAFVFTLLATTYLTNLIKGH